MENFNTRMKTVFVRPPNEYFNEINKTLNDMKVNEKNLTKYLISVRYLILALVILVDIDLLCFFLVMNENNLIFIFCLLLYLFVFNVYVLTNQWIIIKKARILVNIKQRLKEWSEYINLAIAV